MNRKVLGLAVIAALAAGTAANASNQLLVPFFKQGGGVHTLLTVANTNTDPRAQSDFNQPVHTIYMYKSHESKNMAACKHADGFARMSSNDLMQFTPLDPARGGYDLIGMNSDQSTPYYLQELDGSNIAAGYMIFATESATHDLAGFANVYDTVNGLSYAFRAIENEFSVRDAGDNQVGVNEGDFVVSQPAAVPPAVPTTLTRVKAPFGSDQYTASWQNVNVLESNWYVLVMGANMAGFDGLDAQVSGGAAVSTDVNNSPSGLLVPTIQTTYGVKSVNGVNTTTAGVINPAGGISHYADATRVSLRDGWIFDNDENIVSRSLALDIVCNGVLTLSDLKRFAPKGGWANLQFSPRTSVGLATDAQGDLVASSTNAVVATDYLAPTVLVWKVESVVDTANLGFGAARNRSMTLAPEAYTLPSVNHRRFQ